MNNKPWRVRLYVGRSRNPHDRYFRTQFEADTFHLKLHNAAMVSKIRVIVGKVKHA